MHLLRFFQAQHLLLAARELRSAAQSVTPHRPVALQRAQQLLAGGAQEGCAAGGVLQRALRLAQRVERGPSVGGRVLVWVHRQRGYAEGAAELPARA